MPAPAVEQTMFVPSESDATHAPAPQPAPQPEPEKPAHSARTLRLAQEFGYSQADIDSMSPAQLDESVHQVNLAMLRAARQREADMLGMQQRDAAGRRPQARQPQPEPAPAPAEPDDMADLLNPDNQYDPKLVSVLKRLNEENKGLREKFGQVEQAEKHRTAAMIDEAIDSAFEAVAKTHGHLYGNGPISTLPKGAPEIQRRVKIIRAAGLSQNDSPRVIAKKIAETIADLTPAAPAQAESVNDSLYAAAMNGQPANGQARPAANGQPQPQQPAAARPRDPVTGQFLTDEEVARRQAWDAGSLARPTTRAGGREPDGKQKAIRTVAEMLQERNGAASLDDDQTLDKLFPDLG